MNVLKKIDRVNSAEEAYKFQSMGADIIGISMCEESHWEDDRNVNKEVAKSIKKVLNKSKLACELDLNSFNTDIIDEFEFDYIQISNTDLPPIEFRQYLESKNIGIIYSDIVATHDDDPSWILSRYNDVPNLNAAYYQIDLLGDIEKSWEFFTSESPNYPDELQINDIIKIGEQFPLLITLDFDANNIAEIVETIPPIKGICMPLSDWSNRNNIHYFDNLSVINILNNLGNEQKS